MMDKDNYIKELEDQTEFLEDQLIESHKKIVDLNKKVANLQEDMHRLKRGSKSGIYANDPYAYQYGYQQEMAAQMEREYTQRQQAVEQRARAMAEEQLRQQPQVAYVTNVDTTAGVVTVANTPGTAAQDTLFGIDPTAYADFTRRGR